MIATALLTLAMAGMQLHSGQFPPNGTIPRASMAARCGGQNVTPSLQWSGAPGGTKSYALVVHDPDAPIPGGFYHWIVYDLPATAHALSPDGMPPGSQLGMASTGKAAYHGPCPPPGPAHHYVFTLYALDVARLKADEPLSATQLQQRIAGHVLARATITGLAARP